MPANRDTPTSESSIDREARIKLAEAAGLGSVVTHDRLVSMLERLAAAVGEQQYTLASRGWKSERVSGAVITWSAAGARKEQYDVIQERLKEANELVEQCNAR